VRDARYGRLDDLGTPADVALAPVLGLEWDAYLRNATAGLGGFVDRGADDDLGEIEEPCARCPVLGAFF